MPRTLSEHTRNQLESRNADDVRLTFVRIVAQDGAAQHLVCEGNAAVSYAGGLTIGYRWRNAEWIGIPFRVQWLTDDDRGARANIQVPNISRKIGIYAQDLDFGSTILVACCWLSDWDMAVDADNFRSPLVSDPQPSPFLETRERQYLKNIGGDSVVIEADFGPRDYATEPFPKTRSVPTVYPALTR